MKDEMDILREVGSIAAAHGSRALSEMLNKRINLAMPNLHAVKPQRITKKISTEKPVISIKSRILTGLSGSILLILEEKSAFQLINICYKKERCNREEELTEVGLSTIKEVGNVVVGSYIGALSVFLRTPIIPSIPTLISGPLQEIIDSTISHYETEDYILLIEAIFEEAERKISGMLYFVITPQAMKEIQESCKKILDGLKREHRK